MAKKWKRLMQEDLDNGAKQLPETDTAKQPENLRQAHDQASKPNPGHTTGHAYGGSFIGLSRGGAGEPGPMPGENRAALRAQMGLSPEGWPPTGAAPGPVPGQTGEWSIDCAGPYEPPRGAREAIDAYAGIKADPHASLVRRPDHYARWKIEPITFIMRNHLPFWAGSIIKYVMRAGYKQYDGMDALQSELCDLRKAARYIEMRINFLEGKEEL